MHPGDITHGNVVVSGLTVGSTATYSCNEGYNLNGVEERVCQSDGEWSDIAPVCHIVSKLVRFNFRF